jgi:aminocarboxymuconate-semialdehyde decarboxylase
MEKALSQQLTGSLGFPVGPERIAHMDADGIDVQALSINAYWYSADRDGALGNVIGNPLETTIALSHLIFEGTLDRFPDLKICAAHGGGYLPSYAARMDHGCAVFPDQCKGPTLKKQPSEYLKQLYFDSIVFTPEGLRHLVAECGPSQVVIGTDYAVPWVKDPVDLILDTPTLSDADRIAILGGTAAKLLRLAS